MPSITPFLWFDDRMEAAVAHYASVFNDVTVTSLNTRTGQHGMADGMAHGYSLLDAVLIGL